MAVIGFPQILMWLLNFILCSHRKKTEFPYIYGYVCFCEMNIYCISDLKHDKLYDVKMLYNLHSTRRKGKKLSHNTLFSHFFWVFRKIEEKTREKKILFQVPENTAVCSISFWSIFSIEWRSLTVKNSSVGKYVCMYDGIGYNWFFLFNAKSWILYNPFYCYFYGFWFYVGDWGGKRRMRSAFEAGIRLWKWFRALKFDVKSSWSALKPQEQWKSS